MNEKRQMQMMKSNGETSCKTFASFNHFLSSKTNTARDSFECLHQKPCSMIHKIDSHWLITIWTLITLWPDRVSRPTFKQSTGFVQLAKRHHRLGLHQVLIALSPVCFIDITVHEKWTAIIVAFVRLTLSGQRGLNKMSLFT